ncbi:hypothetical protein [Clostridium sp. 19966]|uniref:hypothetical protein n=1 Tax=Clostridium sp. 19966 TaxID=2768166 RepID=UPI0028F04DEF|nr:hypothetical protein [Clostridium sp. 19966]
MGEISGDAIFIDGTKIETSANKYTFVWKKAVVKNLKKLLAKLADFVDECEATYGIKLVYQNQVKLNYVKKLRKKLYALKEKENVEFVMDTAKEKIYCSALLKSLKNT